MSEQQKSNGEILQPELRFKGFTEAWRPQKLLELAESYSGGTPSVNNSSYYDGKIPFIRSGEIHSTCTELNITEHGLKKSSAKMVNRGDILYALYGATSGEVAISKIKGAVNQAILVLKPQGHNSLFICNWLGKQKKEILSTYLQGGQGNLSAKIIKSLQIAIPNEEEQKNIGEFFQTLDLLIAKNQRKLELLEKLKKGYLQKIFSQELRFEGFTEPWKPQKLGEIAKFSKGTGFSKSDLTSSGYPVILYGQLYTDYKTIINKIENYVQFKGKVLSISGQVLIPASGETPEDIARAAIIEQKDVYIGGDLNVLTLASTITPAFIAINLSNGPAKKQLASYAQGKSVVHLRNSDLKKIVIKLPENSEQKQVSTFFYLLDNHIDMCKRKLGQLERLKQTSLRKMFI